MKIYNLGSLNIDYVYSGDHFVLAGETLASCNMQIFAGGKGLNQSIALSRANADVIHGAILGQNGEFLKQIMSESGVNTDRIKFTDQSCGHAIIQVDKGGQNCILLYGGTNRAIDRDYIEQFLFDAQENDILLLQNETSGLDIAFEVATDKKMQIAFNPSPYDNAIQNLPLEQVKWWFCNELEAAALFGNGTPQDIADSFIHKYPDSNLVLTLGEKGCVFKNCDMFLTQAAYKTNVVDTTAAGDTFTGYFISAVAKGCDISVGLKLASKAASVSVSRQGAAPSIPFINEIIIEN